MTVAMSRLSLQLQRAVRPLDDPPCAPGWNHAELCDLLGPGPRRAAAVLVPVIERGQQPTVLFTQRTDHLLHHAGQVSFPGGGVEDGDADAIAAALRETREEVGIDAALMHPFGYLDCFETISGYCVTPVVAHVDATYRAVPDPHEVADIFEVPLAYFLQPENLRRRSIVFRGCSREIVEFLPDGRSIWGATAAMMLSLVHRMEALR